MMKQLFINLSNIEKDKLLHSFYGTLLFAIVPYSSYIAFSFVVVIALAKEIYDEYLYQGFCWKDIFYTIFIPVILVLKDVFESWLK